MIQRLQTVYLLISTISVGLLFVFPIAWFYGQNNTIELLAYAIVDHVPANEPLFDSYFIMPLIGLTFLIALLPFVAIFIYKQLKKQLLMVRVSIALTLVYIAGVFLFYVESISKVTQVNADYEFGIFLPLITLVFLFLAMRGIQKDIKLLRSVDRLR